MKPASKPSQPCSYKLLFVHASQHRHDAAAGCAGALITQPQWLVSGTRVAGSYKCLRQSVLEERCGGQPSDKATLGTLLHELLQVSPTLSSRP